MKRKLLLVSLSVVLVLVFAQVAFAWGGGPRGFSGGNWVNMADQLQLTDEQVQAIQDIQKKSFDDMQDERAKMQQLRNDLRLLQWQPGADQAQVEAKIQELNDLRQKMFEKQQHYRTEMMSQFTDEQLAEMVRNGCGFRGGKGFYGGPVGR
jgi:Spy/CpxP family protein refolding chaperone